MKDESLKALAVVISAPAGAGKTTVCKAILDSNPNITRAITCTTRAPREGEVHGKDYYFMDEKEFLTKVKAGEFIEHATVHSNLYGTLWSEVLGKLESGKDVLLNIDVQGADSIRKKANELENLKRALVTVFLTTPSLEELERRLRNRGTDSEKQIQTRLAVAAHEIEQWKEFDYLILSQSMEDDFNRMQSIIVAEKLRKERSEQPEL